MSLLSLGVEALERGLVPDAWARVGIRRLCGERLLDRESRDDAARQATLERFVSEMSSGPIAPVPAKANEQHYELPPEFFQAVLGPWRKYSCCYWGEGVSTLAAAEEAALQITCERARLANGQQILELGCGWGSLSLWMAERYPDSQITAVSNSAPQRQFIEAEAARRGYTNLRVITADMNDFQPAGGPYDRVVSVEMFEHMRNYARLLERIAGWIKPEGQLFVHIFCHRRLAYPYETDGAANWMGRYFFTGGIMPSHDLLGRFPEHLQVAEQWTWNGQHYEQTANAWLANLDAQRDRVLPILQSAYGPQQARRWFHRWRVFFLAVAELFGYADGMEWFVAHYRLERTTR